MLVEVFFEYNCIYFMTFLQYEKVTYSLVSSLLSVLGLSGSPSGFVLIWFWMTRLPKSISNVK
jgi:hypothetical protein